MTGGSTPSAPSAISPTSAPPSPSRRDEGAVAVAEAEATIGLAHTRWATHGRVTEENAHPHSDEDGRIHIVLNGIVENHSELRRDLLGDGHEFSSETDAEIVAHLIERHYDGDLTEAVRAAFADLRGHYAFVAMHVDHPELLVGARQECPLVIGVGEGETFLASAIPAFLRETRTVMQIENGEIVTITPEARRDHRRRAARRTQREIEEVTWDEEAAERGGYSTFMMKEIHEQPDAVAETITDRLPEVDHVDLSELTLTPEQAAKLRRIVIVACGTSYHAGLVGRYAIETWARIPVEMDVASEYRYRDPVIGTDDLVVGITQSGETADTLAAMRLARERGAHVLAITNVMGSQATRDADSVLFTRAGLEIGVAATKTFTSQVAAIYLLGLWMAQARDHLGTRADLRADQRAEGAAAQDRGDDRVAGPAGQGDRPKSLRGPLLPLPRSSYRPADLPRGRTEDEGDLLHPLRRLRGRRDEARADRPARRDDAGRLRRDRQPRARQGALQRRRGPRARRRRDRDRNRRAPTRSPRRPISRSVRAAHRTGSCSRSSRSSRCSSSPTTRPDSSA